MNRIASQAQLELAVFETGIGWFAVAHRNSVISLIKFGAVSKEDAIARFRQSSIGKILSEDIRPSKTKPDWQKAFVDYALGKAPSFDKVKLEKLDPTRFQKSVLEQCRLIPYGTTLTYGELARKAGAPKAARAVGAVMKSNRFPIVIPCHRVTAASGIGGFSASDGVSSKRALLMMEGAINKPDQLMLPGLNS